MASVRPAINPFTLMMDPQSVLDIIGRSERLERLQRRVCHPLDKVVMPTTLAKQLASDDRTIDEQYESDTWA